MIYLIVIIKGCLNLFPHHYLPFGHWKSKVWNVNQLEFKLEKNQQKAIVCVG